LGAGKVGRKRNVTRRGEGAKRGVAKKGVTEVRKKRRLRVEGNKALDTCPSIYREG